MRYLLILLLFIVFSCVPEHSARIHWDPQYEGEGAEPRTLINDSEKYLEVVIQEVFLRDIIDTIRVKPYQTIDLGRNSFIIIDQWETEPFDEGFAI